MPNLQVTRDTNNILAAQRRPDTSDKLWLIDPEYAALTFFVRKLSKKGSVDTKFRHFEKQSPSRYDAVNYSTGYTTGATDVLVDDGTKFKIGNVVLNVTTDEQMRVTGVSTNTVSFSRAWGETAAGLIANNDVLIILGNANAEGAALPAAITSNPVEVSNYLQITREPFGVTETEDATELEAEKSDMAGLRREHLQLHLKDMARATYFGEAKEDLTGSHPVRATAGLKSHIATNIKNVATLTEAEFEDWVADLFQNGGDKKMGFVSPLIGSAVNSWAKGKLVMYPKDKTYGISITNYLSLHGSIDFTLERILGENSTWNGHSFATDMSLLSYRFLNGNGKNRDTKLLKNRQAAGADEMIEEYLTEWGFQCKLENRHGYIKSVTAYS